MPNHRPRKRPSGRRRLILVAATAVMGAVVATTTVAVSWADGRGSSEGEHRVDVPSAPIPEKHDPESRDGHEPPRLTGATADRVRTAPVGRVIAEGPSMTVDEVPRAGSLVRLTLDGDFPLGALDYTVYIDGEPVGAGIPTPDLQSIRVSLQSAEVARTGAVVSFRYGDREQIRVGTLTEVDE